MFERCDVSSEGDALGPGLPPFQKVARRKVLNHEEDENSFSPRTDTIGEYRNAPRARSRGIFKEQHASLIAAYEPNFLHPKTRDFP